jgi:hypothetical protein
MLSSNEGVSSIVISEPIEYCSGLEESEKGDGQLIKVDGESTMAFGVSEEAFNHMSVLVEMPDEAIGVATMAMRGLANGCPLCGNVVTEVAQFECTVGDDPLDLKRCSERCAYIPSVQRSGSEVKFNWLANAIYHGSELEAKAVLHESHRLSGSRANMIGAVSPNLDVEAIQTTLPAQSRSSELSEKMHPHGYRACVTAGFGRVRLRNAPFSLERIRINGCDDNALFLAKLNGAYDCLGISQHLSRIARVLACGRLRPNENIRPSVSN